MKTGNDRAADANCGVRGSASQATPADMKRVIYREMIRGLIEDKQLDTRTQLDAIRFARQLDIDEMEAADIIAALQHALLGAAAIPIKSPGFAGVAIVVLLLNAAWFWYVLSR